MGTYVVRPAADQKDRSSGNENALVVLKYPSYFSLSTGRVWNAARNVLTQETANNVL